MKFSTTSVLLAAALGVSAHPSGHAHKRAHNSVEARGDFVMANKPAEAPTTTSAAPVASPTATASSGSESSGTATVKPFCGGNSKRATAAEIAYKGNVGAGGSYGCNIMTIDNSLVDKYQYTMVFDNAGADTTCFCWNKIGPDGGINGFFKGNQAITFDVPAGGKQAVAVDTNSQVGCACGSGGPELTPIGQFASTWVEADFGNISNGGWSGADASSLVAAAAGMTIPGLKVCGTGDAAGTCSTIFPGGKGDNAFTAGTEYLDGLGLNLAPGKTSLLVTIDYQG
ncbi:hypothetical protein J3F83DRAFT_734752 [Trichoderma novae-zelandiae]